MVESEFFIDATTPPLKGDRGVLHSLSRYYNRNDYYQGFGLETPNVPKVDVVRYPSLISLPYSVQFDTARWGQLLSYSGMNDGDIEECRISLFDKMYGVPSFIADKLAATTSPRTKEIEFPVNNSWRVMGKYSEDINKKLQNPKKWDIKFWDVPIVESELISLRRTPREESVKRIQEMSVERLNENLNRTLLHETHHLVNLGSKAYLKKISLWAGGVTGIVFSEDLFSLIGYLTEFPYKLPVLITLGILSAPVLAFINYIIIYGLGHDLEPIEIAADKFAKKHQQDLRWQGIIKVTPKSQL